jgi:hypothetical protein
MLPPAAGRVSDPSTEIQTPARDNHRGQGMGHLPFYTHVTGVPRPTAHNAARPHLQRCARADRRADPRKLLARPPQSHKLLQPRGLGRRLRLLVPSCEGGANIRSSSCPEGPFAASAVATVGPGVDNSVCFIVLCNRHRFNSFPGPPPRGGLGCTHIYPHTKPITLSSLQAQTLAMFC